MIITYKYVGINFIPTMKGLLHTENLSSIKIKFLGTWDYTNDKKFLPMKI